ncbi:MAG TPA: TolC family protein, partial [Gemmataceae bacterium]|nr:TolC family protein [Gemmataceae bacterium]
MPEPSESDPASRVVPIQFDTVFRLAEEQNAQIALAREKLHESQTELQLAAKGWLPNIYAGLGYYRHEGGIQNEDGTLTHSSSGALFPGLNIQTEFDLREAVFQRVNAERKLWQQRGELRKVTNETLLEAATTYIDLLTARRSAALVRELEPLQDDLLRRAEKQLTPTDQRARVLVESIQAEISGRKQALARLRQQGDAAAAKLAYLLGLPPDARLVPTESTLTPLELVDVSRPVEELVARVLTNGPGLRELEGLLAVIQCGIDQASGPRGYLPTVCVNMAEGAFGAGP